MHVLEEAVAKEMVWQEARRGKNQDDSKMGWMPGMPTERKKSGNLGWGKVGAWGCPNVSQ